MKYIPTIGIETHVQLKTTSKLFSSVGNDARQAPPNNLISHIDVGLPGALPVLNKGAIELACRAAFALNTEPQKFFKFDRKHYFYPDLPKGYQVSQYEDPIIKGGYVEIEINGQAKKIGITRAHLEEDAGKNIHPAGADYSLVDLNRAGTPLLEIVSEPVIHSAAEAKAYVRELYLLMKYAGVSDVDLYHGNMRFDVNTSLSTDENKPGVRSEVKNLNSFKSVEAAIEYEIKRQTEILARGDKVIQETRGWDEAKQKTTSQRGKEEAHDYRYMPEPDIPPIELEPKFVEKIKAAQPSLPKDIRKKLNMLSIEPQVVEDILERPDVAELVLESMAKTNADNSRRIAFWLLQDQRAPIDLARLIELAELSAGDKISSSAAKTILEELTKTTENPEVVAQKLKLLQVSDEGELNDIVKKVIADNPKAVEDIKAGEQKAVGFLVGQVMAASRGQANPAVAQKLIKNQLGI